ncbi:hypothetical protein OAG1_26160 [Agarivorans sp. OAG1]|nr:hypothetical protein OAG1_26160 [Agarivorans sp. OAG1]
MEERYMKKRTTTSAILGVSLAALLGGCGATSKVEPNLDVTSYKRHQFLPPQGKTLMFIGQDIQTINEFVADTGVQPAAVTAYASADLTGVLNAFPESHGSLDIPGYAEDYPNATLAIGLWLKNTYKKLAEGHPRSVNNVDRLVKHLKGLNRPIMLRIGYEVDGYWNNYHPEEFKAAWKVITAAIAKNDAQNITTVWQIAGYCASMDNSVFTETQNSFKGLDYDAWYPGDEHVDWLGLSYFSQPRDCLSDTAKNAAGGLPSAFGSLSDVDEQGNSLALDNIIAYLNAKDKPIFVAEASPKYYWIERGEYKPDADTTVNNLQKVSGEQIWQDWYEPFFDFLKRHQQSIRAVSYINMHWESFAGWSCDIKNTRAVKLGLTCKDGIWGDARVQVNPYIKQQFFNRLDNGKYIYRQEDGGFDQLSGWTEASVAITAVTAAKSEIAKVVKSSPFHDKPAAIPSRIQAQEYDKGGEGVAYKDSSGINHGANEWGIRFRENELVDIGKDPETESFVVGWTAKGEWLNYSVSVAETGTYTANFRLGHGGRKAGSFKVLLNGETLIEQVNIPATKSWETYQVVSLEEITLTQGEHLLTIEFTASGDYNTPGNIDWFEFVQQ